MNDGRAFYIFILQIIFLFFSLAKYPSIKHLLAIVNCMFVQIGFVAFVAFTGKAEAKLTQRTKLCCVELINSFN